MIPKTFVLKISMIKRWFINTYLELIFGKRSRVAFIMILAMTSVSIVLIPRLTFNYNMESFFDHNDPDVLVYETFKDVFENENNSLIIGITNDMGIFHLPFLQKIDSLSEELASLNEIQEVVSPTTLQDYAIAPLVGFMKIPSLHLDDPTKLSNDEQKIYKGNHHKRSFFSSDKKSIAIVIRYDGATDVALGKEFLNRINGLLDSYGFDDFSVAGRLHTQEYYIREMKSEMLYLSALAFLLFAFVLYFIFRNWAFTTISMVVVLISLIWLFGIISLFGISINLMIVLLPALIFILGTSISIHLLSSFRDEFTSGTEKNSSILLAIRETGIPNFLNALTTAIGFGSLYFIPVQPLQQFGLLAATGIMITFCAGILIIPLFLIHYSPDTPGLISSTKQSDVPVKMILNLIQHKKLSIILTFGLLVLAGTVALTRISINNYFLDDLSERSTLKSDLRYFEKNFSGIKPIEILVHPFNSSINILEMPAILEIEKAERFLTENYQCGFLLSPLTVIRSINQSLHGRASIHYTIPDSESALRKIIAFADKYRIWDKYAPVFGGSNSEYARISFRTSDSGSKINADMEQDFYNYINKNTTYLSFKVTGVAHLLDNTNNHITGYLLQGILVAIFTTTLVIWLFTRSASIAIFSVVTNIIPLVFTAGMMGLFDIPLKVSTSLMFTIVYGIAVDDTIHLLNAYMRYKNRFNNDSIAITMAVKKLTKPMIFTSVVLLVGFMIFTTSAFQSIQILGLLVGSSLLIGLITDLLLLPVLLKWMVARNLTSAMVPAGAQIT